MSEYQFYEFRAVDRRLTEDDKQAIRKLSSRVEPTDTTATFVYSYSDFRHDPYQVLHQYFDAMLYITNWGTHQLMFKFPKGAIPDHIMKTYQFGENMVWTQEKTCSILNIQFDELEQEYGWIEGEGMLSEILPIRDEILDGDYRALYLGWLMSAVYQTEMYDWDDSIEIDPEDDELAQFIEPPVPNGLKQLSPALKAFAGFWGLSDDLVVASAQKSEPLQQIAENLEDKLPLLPDDEKLAFLKRLLAREPRLDIALAKRLREFSTPTSEEKPTLAGRSIVELNNMAEEIQAQRIAVEKQKKAKALQKKMEQLAPKKDDLWAQVHELVSQKSTSFYDKAIEILKDLQALAQYQDDMNSFKERIKIMRQSYPKLRGLLDRLDRAGL
ncbi:MAG: hypothetical protein MUE54_11430 [Anaerolineae bacterium]|jgi:hypothetical protein|nr:hypothetical protein [Anaerolineae bacterium]